MSLNDIIIAVIWLTGAMVWVAATFWNVKAGNTGHIVYGVVCVVLYAVIGVLYLLKSNV